MRMCDFAHVLDGTIALAGARGIRFDAKTRKRFSLRRVVVRWVKWVMGEGGQVTCMRCSLCSFSAIDMCARGM